MDLWHGIISRTSHPMACFLLTDELAAVPEDWPNGSNSEWFIGTADADLAG